MPTSLGRRRQDDLRAKPARAGAYAYTNELEFFTVLAECYRTAALDGLNRLSHAHDRPSSPPTIAPAA